jgi:hypothetical protein
MLNWIYLQYDLQKQYALYTKISYSNIDLTS